MNILTNIMVYHITNNDEASATIHTLCKSTIVSTKRQTLYDVFINNLEKKDF